MAHSSFLRGKLRDIPLGVSRSAQYRQGGPMSLLSQQWPRCPNHLTWMQPALEPQRWQCNYPMFGGPDFDGRGSTCTQSVRYRWWRYLDRTVFSLLEGSQQMGCFYCPVCEAFFGLPGSAHGEPYFTFCSKCLWMGTEHYLRYQSCGKCGREVRFFGDKESLFRVDLPAVYCRKCRKFFCSSECISQHLCVAERPRHEN